MFYYSVSECSKDFATNFFMESLPLRTEVENDSLHLKAAAKWLLRSVEKGNGGSSSYVLWKGIWSKPFPETTGYIIPTLFDCYNYYNDLKYSIYAKRCADWLIDVQLENGACMGGLYDVSKDEKDSIIFNTGQNIFGFLRAYEETGKDKYLESSIRAGDFLVKNTDSKNIWNKYLHNSLPHTYNSRVCWALLLLSQKTGIEKYKEVSLSNLNWVLKQQLENGWFNNANFKPTELPNTHGIAYTLRGLLESHKLTGDSSLLGAVELTAWKLLRIFEIKKKLPTFWDKNWKSHNKFPGTSHYIKNNKWVSSCLTGNIQLSIVWMKLYFLNNDLRYLNSAFKMLDHIKTFQNIKTRCEGINGAIKGSFPIYGDYATMSFPNWATKFFVDALIIKGKIVKQFSKESI